MAQKRFNAICIIFVVAVTCLGAKGAVAQDAAEGKLLRVAVKPIAPFVFKHETELSGFSIDLWNALAQSLKVETTWVEVTTVGDQLQAVKSGKADAAIAAITITRERENIVDFTQPYFDSGLQIMVHTQGGNRFAHEVLNMRLALRIVNRQGACRAITDQRLFFAAKLGVEIATRQLEKRVGWIFLKQRSDYGERFLILLIVAV